MSKAKNYIIDLTADSNSPIKAQALPKGSSQPAKKIACRPHPAVDAPIGIDLCPDDTVNLIDYHFQEHEIRMPGFDFDCKKPKLAKSKASPEHPMSSPRESMIDTPIGLNLGPDDVIDLAGDEDDEELEMLDIPLVPWSRLRNSKSNNDSLSKKARTLPPNYIQKASKIGSDKTQAAKPRVKLSPPGKKASAAHPSPSTAVSNIDKLLPLNDKRSPLEKDSAIKAAVRPRQKYPTPGSMQTAKVPNLELSNPIANTENESRRKQVNESESNKRHTMDLHRKRKANDSEVKSDGGGDQIQMDERHHDRELSQVSSQRRKMQQDQHDTCPTNQLVTKKDATGRQMGDRPTSTADKRSTEINKEPPNKFQSSGRGKRKRQTKKKKCEKKFNSEINPATTLDQYAVHIKGIPFEATADEVMNFFGLCGNIHDIVESHLPRVPESGRLQGWGRIVFGSLSSHQKALNLSGNRLRGQPLAIKSGRGSRQFSEKQTQRSRLHDPTILDIKDLLVGMENEAKMERTNKAACDDSEDPLPAAIRMMNDLFVPSPTKFEQTQHVMECETRENEIIADNNEGVECVNLEKEQKANRSVGETSHIYSERPSHLVAPEDNPTSGIQDQVAKGSILSILKKRQSKNDSGEQSSNEVIRMDQAGYLELRKDTAAPSSSACASNLRDSSPMSAKDDPANFKLEMGMSFDGSSWTKARHVDTNEKKISYFLEQVHGFRSRGSGACESDETSLLETSKANFTSKAKFMNKQQEKSEEVTASSDSDEVEVIENPSRESGVNNGVSQQRLDPEVKKFENPSLAQSAQDDETIELIANNANTFPKRFRPRKPKRDFARRANPEQGKAVSDANTRTNTAPKPEMRYVFHTATREPGPPKPQSQTMFGFTTPEDAMIEQDRLLQASAARVRSKAKFLVSRNTAPSRSKALTFSHPTIDVHMQFPFHWKFPDPYTRLGLPKAASIQLVKTHYRCLARIYHPDKSRSNETTVKFQAIAQAYKSIIGP